MATWFLDEKDGDDCNNGTSLEQAVKTRKRLNELLSRRVDYYILVPGVPMAPLNYVQRFLMGLPSQSTVKRGLGG